MCVNACRSVLCRHGMKFAQAESKKIFAWRQKWLEQYFE